MIFGVSGTKRWQGYALMESKAIGEETILDDAEVSAVDEDDKNLPKKFSPFFKILWKKRFGNG